MQSEIFQAFICLFCYFYDYGLQLMKTPTRKCEYYEMVQYCRLRVSHSNQLINPRHLQRVPEPLNGLMYFSRQASWISFSIRTWHLPTHTHCQ